MTTILALSMAFLSLAWSRLRPLPSELLRHVLVRIFRFAILLVLLPLRQLHFLVRRLLVRSVRQQVADDVEPGAPLVVRARDVPRCESGIGRGEHLVAGARIVVPAVIGLDVHRRELPDLARILDAVLEAPRLLLWAHLEPILDEDHAR